MKTLQELIPYCSKRDKQSTFDDAIKYIKTLQNQIKVMAIEGGYSTMNSPQTMVSSPALIPQTCPPGTETLHENETKMGTSEFLAGFPDPYLLPVSGLPPPDGYSTIQSPLDFSSPMGIVTPLCPTSHPLDFTSAANTTPLCPTGLDSHGSSPSS
ncbi:transcription factor PIF5-like [Salvia splendens]|uniref:transcription factor PIF5-like n=1 Tax=Salvia splendens TaxID=180675 RepID=UPI001C277876|nr:transcription factor PIF5-like [Salvia splendens]